jgi:tRNA (guanine-N7-)-methyltransferase
MAQQHPGNDYIGIDVHRPGVGRLLLQLDKLEIENVRVFCEDAKHVFVHCLPPNLLDAVFIFFPDPWHKKRHHKRRLIQTDFVRLVVKALKPGGRLHIATDWQGYAEHIMQVLSEEPLLTNCAGVRKYSPRPNYRPLTKYERRGQVLGHGVWDLNFKKIHGEPSA